jgi:hypothetical protein
MAAAAITAPKSGGQLFLGCSLIHDKISTQPTWHATGHTDTNVPVTPWGSPWATFAAIVAAMPAKRRTRAQAGTGLAVPGGGQHRGGRGDQPVTREGEEGGGHHALPVIAGERVHVRETVPGREQGDGRDDAGGGPACGLVRSVHDGPWFRPGGSRGNTPPWGRR